MAGVGPFAVPAAKKRCLVLGNDLNPDSTKWMAKNRIDNRVEKALRVSTLDGRAFIRSAALEIWRNPFEPLGEPFKSARQAEKAARRRREAKKQVKQDGDVQELTQEATKMSLAAGNTGSGGLVPTSTSNIESTYVPEPTPRHISHFVMNLPGSALEFLDAYNGCYKPLLDEPDFPVDAKDTMEMATIHVHCFTKEPEGQAALDDICKVSLLASVWANLETEWY